MSYRRTRNEIGRERERESLGIGGVDCCTVSSFIHLSLRIGAPVSLDADRNFYERATEDPSPPESLHRGVAQYHEVLENDRRHDDVEC